MAFLAAAAPYIGLIGAGVSAYGQYETGRAADANARAVAIQQERQAKAAQAEAQREAIYERKRAQHLQSRARAVAAASGGSVSDPTVQNILGDIEDEGEFRALSALYSGDSDAALAKYAAGTTRREGRAARRGSYLNASSTILSGASSFYSKRGT